MLSDDFTAQDLEGTVQLDSGGGIFADPVLVSADSRGRMFCSPTPMSSSVPSAMTMIVNAQLEQPLTALREILENNLKISLKDYEFYLQDTLKLDPHGSLVAQCTHETGTVQVHVEIKQMDASHKPRINILDIMISADELNDVDRTSVIQHETKSSSNSGNRSSSNFCTKQNLQTVNASSLPLPTTRNLPFVDNCGSTLLSSSRHRLTSDMSDTAHTHHLLGSTSEDDHLGTVSGIEGDEMPNAGDPDISITFDEPDEAQLAVTSLQLAYGSPESKHIAMQTHSSFRDRFIGHSSSTSDHGCFTSPSRTCAPTLHSQRLDRNINDVHCVSYPQSVAFESAAQVFGNASGSMLPDDPSIMELSCNRESIPARKRTRAARDRNAPKRTRLRAETTHVNQVHEPLFRIGNAPVTSMRMMNGVTYMIVSPDSTAQADVAVVNQQFQNDKSYELAHNSTATAPKRQSQSWRTGSDKSQTVIWQMDSGFASLMQTQGMPTDPTVWDANHVHEWLIWAARNFDLVDVLSAASAASQSNSLATSDAQFSADLLDPESGYLSHVVPLTGSQLLSSTPQALVRLLNIRMETLTNAQKQSVRAFLTHFEILKTLKIVAARTVCASSQRTAPAKSNARRLAADSASRKSITTNNQPSSSTVSVSGISCEVGNDANRFSSSRTAMQNSQPYSNSVTLRDTAVPSTAVTDVESTSNAATQHDFGAVVDVSANANGVNGNSSNVNSNKRSRTNGWLTNEVSIIHNVARSFAGGSYMQLWQFLLDLLTDAEYTDLIRWTTDDGAADGEFEFIAPQRVAELWGAKKQNGRSSHAQDSSTQRGMTYAKMARILRYYYQANVLAKVPAKRRTYRFTIDLKEVTGYEPAELKRLVETCRIKRKANAAGGTSRKRLPRPVDALKPTRAVANPNSAISEMGRLHNVAAIESTSQNGVAQHLSKSSKNVIATVPSFHGATHTRSASTAVTSVQRTVKPNSMIVSNRVDVTRGASNAVTRLIPQPTVRRSQLPMQIISVHPVQPTLLTTSNNLASAPRSVIGDDAVTYYDASGAASASSSAADWSLPQFSDESSRVRTISSSSTSSLIRQFMNSGVLGLPFPDNEAQLQADGNDMDMMFVL